MIIASTSPNTAYAVQGGRAGDYGVRPPFTQIFCYALALLRSTIVPRIIVVPLLHRKLRIRCAVIFNRRVDLLEGGCRQRAIKKLYNI
jgi:hypothetical protein